jgi:hypothetical protein
VADVKMKKGQQQHNREQDREHKERIINTEPIEAFKMRPGETWHKTFAHKNVDGRVPWGTDTCKMCPRWFIMNYCFGNCFHLGSHVKGSKVPANKITAFHEYMSTICGANN